MTPKPTRRVSRFVAGGLAFTLSIVSSAICFAAVLQMEEAQQHESCPMGHESDAPETAKLDCCIAQSPQFAGVAPASALLLAQPAVISLIDTTPESLVPVSSALPAFDPDVPKLSRTPTYLFVSSFRI